MAGKHGSAAIANKRASDIRGQAIAKGYATPPGVKPQPGSAGPTRGASASSVPVPDKSTGGRQPSVAKAPGAAGFAMRIGKGATHAGKGATTNAGGITAIMALTFGVVALAKIRGTANISTSHALFGGFILLFLLTTMYKFAPGVAMAFAVLVLISALLEYGVAAFSGMFGAGTGIPAAVSATSTPVLGQTAANTPVVNSQQANTALYNAAGYYGPALPTSYGTS